MTTALRRLAAKVRSRASRPAPEPSIAVELVPGSKSVYFIFGGIFGEMGLPRYEFHRTAEELHANKIFFRDFAQAWYQRGLPELGPGISGIDEYVRSTIDNTGATKVRFVGNSMGGFAALLFCARAGVGRAIAFAPQTFVSAEQRELHGDTRWAPNIARLHENLTGDEVLDLGPFVRDVNPGVEADVYVGSDDPLDLAHVEALSGLPNIVVHKVEVGGHAIVRALRDAGELVAILDA